MFAAALVLMSTLPSYQQRGEEALETIRRDFYLPAKKLYSEDESKKQPAFNWPCGVMLSALNGGARLNPKYKPWLREFADSMRKYWRPEGGFDVLPMPKPKDRYYDDNAWMAIALMETSQVLNDTKYLKWGEETIAFVLTGEDDKLGGGIYWRESDKKSKNTCSNAPTAFACARLYKLTGKKQYHDEAIRLYSWTRSKLQDPIGFLYWDNISLSGKIDKMTWSYNTALMIRAHEALAERDDKAPRAAIGKWLDSKSGLIKDDMAFAHLLFEALQELETPSLGLYLDGLYTKARDANGRYGRRWDEVAKEPRKHFRLIDQASAARAYFVACR